MSLNSFVLQNENINKNFQISRKIAETYLDHLHSEINEIGLHIEKRDLIPLSIATYARFDETHQIGPYEKKVNSIREKEVRDIATTPELPEEYLALMYSFAVSSFGAERAIDNGGEVQRLWAHAIEIGLAILSDMFDRIYANRPSEFFKALINLDEEAKKLRI